ncbi:hypothetical protein ABBQ38_006875 [Trebouxia sp. C0009 RCD-2024]
MTCGFLLSYRWSSELHVYKPYCLICLIRAASDTEPPHCKLDLCDHLLIHSYECGHHHLAYLQLQAVPSIPGPEASACNQDLSILKNVCSGIVTALLTIPFTWHECFSMFCISVFHSYLPLQQLPLRLQALAKRKRCVH